MLDPDLCFMPVLFSGVEMPTSTEGGFLVGCFTSRNAQEACCLCQPLKENNCYNNRDSANFSLDVRRTAAASFDGVLPPSIWGVNQTFYVSKVASS